MYMHMHMYMHMYMSSQAAKDDGICYALSGEGTGYRHLLRSVRQGCHAPNPDPGPNPITPTLNLT